jgi:hypothetical protein
VFLAGIAPVSASSPPDLRRFRLLMNSAKCREVIVPPNLTSRALEDGDSCAGEDRTE